MTNKNQPRIPTKLANNARKKLIVVAILFGTAALLSACSTQSATVSPNIDAARLKEFYVVKFGPDNRFINELIRDRLLMMGYKASTGKSEKPPQKVDAVVTYRDKWMWDITMYMLELKVTLRNPETMYPMASGESYRSSLVRKSPEDMVDEVFTTMFKKMNKTAK